MLMPCHAYHVMQVRSEMLMDQAATQLGQAATKLQASIRGSQYRAKADNKTEEVSP